MSSKHEGTIADAIKTANLLLLAWEIYKIFIWLIRNDFADIIYMYGVQS